MGRITVAKKIQFLWKLWDFCHYELEAETAYHEASQGGSRKDFGGSLMESSIVHRY